MRKTFVAIGAGLTLSACGGAAVQSPGRVAIRPANYATGGLERVMGSDARALVQLFGQPDADVREGTARKLQFEGPFCVLDAYLYPRGTGEPKVSYLDARQPDGSTIDRASCVAALTRRDGGR